MRWSVWCLIGISLLSGGCGSKPDASLGLDLKSLTQSKLTTNNFIDSINGVTDLANGTATVPRRPELSIVGWAVDVPSKLPASRVILDLDGKLYPTQYGVVRTDVAGVFSEPAYVNSGYTAKLPTPSGDGQHKLTVDIVSAEGKSYYVGVSRTFVIK